MTSQAGSQVKSDEPYPRMQESRLWIGPYPNGPISRTSP